MPETQGSRQFATVPVRHRVVDQHEPWQFTRIQNVQGFTCAASFRHLVAKFRKYRGHETTNILVVKTNGQSVTGFVPGDVSPFGGLITTGTFYRFIGTTTNTVDFNLNRTVQFSWSGQVIDLCAALS